MHLIEDHAQNAGIPVRFAASKLAEGDEEIEARLNLDTNEKETLEHIICQMEKERGWIGQLRLRICGLVLSKKSAGRQSSNRGKAGNTSEV